MKYAAVIAVWFSLACLVAFAAPKAGMNYPTIKQDQVSANTAALTNLPSWSTMTNLDVQCIADYQQATNYMALAQRASTQGQQVTNLWQAVNSLCNSLVHMHDVVVKTAIVVRQDVSNRSN
jgi:hypothetical protein